MAGTMAWNNLDIFLWPCEWFRRLLQLLFKCHRPSTTASIALVCSKKAQLRSTVALQKPMAASPFKSPGPELEAWGPLAHFRYVWTSSDMKIGCGSAKQEQCSKKKQASNHSSSTLMALKTSSTKSPHWWLMYNPTETTSSFTIRPGVSKTGSPGPKTRPHAAALFVGRQLCPKNRWFVVD